MTAMSGFSQALMSLIVPYVAFVSSFEFRTSRLGSRRSRQFRRLRASHAIGEAPASSGSQQPVGCSATPDGDGRPSAGWTGFVVVTVRGAARRCLLYGA